MNTILQIVIGAIVSMILLMFVLLVVIPYIKTQAKRREGREHTPQPEEIWVQDDGILYIAGVNQSGVELMSIAIAGDGTKNFQRWKDSWPEWHERLKVRTVFFSGRRQPLGDA